MRKGGKFLKKLWCFLVGVLQDNLVLSTGLIMWIGHRWQLHRLNGGWVPEASRSFHYWQPAPWWRLLPWLANPGNPAMSPHAVIGTATLHTVETVERGRERGWEENCLGDELPHYETQGNASSTYATLHYATIHKHVEFRHMRIHVCVDTVDLQGNASALSC